MTVVEFIFQPWCESTRVIRCVFTRGLRDRMQLNIVVQRDRTTKTDDGDTDFSCIINQWLVMKAEKPRIDVYSSYQIVQTYSNNSCRFFSSIILLKYVHHYISLFSNNARALYTEIVVDKIHGHAFSIQLYIYLCVRVVMSASFYRSSSDSKYMIACGSLSNMSKHFKILYVCISVHHAFSIAMNAIKSNCR